MFDRYNKLKAREKKIRNKVEEINVKTNQLCDKLENKINKIKYNKEVKLTLLNRKLKDVADMKQNHVNFIYEDNKENIKLKVFKEYKKQ